MLRLLFAFAGTLLVTAQAPGETAQGLYREGSTQYVGIQYWLQAPEGTQVTVAAARPDTRYELHMRCNVAGFLTVFLRDEGELTEKSFPPYDGLQLRAGGSFKAPGTFKLGAQDASGIVFLFARSQTEQVSTADEALAKFNRLRPALITGTVPDGTDLGTYVVNPQGNQPAGTIGVVR